MRIGLFQASSPTAKRESEYPPLGLGYLSSYLKQYTELRDIVFAPTTDGLAALQPDIIGISAVTQNYTLAIRQARELRERCGVPIVLGGHHITKAADSLDPVFDVGVLGEGEETFRELMEAYAARRWGPSDWRDIDGICFHAPEGTVARTRPRTPIEPLDRVPPPDRELIGAWWTNPSLDTISMITSRGCPFDCIFCSSKRHFDGPTRYHSPEYVVAEMQGVLARWKPRAITFWDDLFIANGKRLSRLADLIVRAGLDEQLELYCSTRANILTEERIRAMVRMGMRGASFGAESASDRVLKYLKGCGISAAHNQQAVESMAAAGLRPACSFVIGSPPETAEDLQLTLDFVRRNRDLLAAAEFWPLVPLPGTPLWDDLVAAGRIPTPVEDWSRFSLAVRGRGDSFWNSYLYLNEQMPLEEFKLYYYQLQEEGLLLELRLQDELARAERRRLEERIRELEAGRSLPAPPPPAPRSTRVARLPLAVARPGPPGPA